jgi:hypothetical protein
MWRLLAGETRIIAEDGARGWPHRGKDVPARLGVEAGGVAGKQGARP